MNKERSRQASLEPINNEDSLEKALREIAAENGGEYELQPTARHNDVSVESLRTAIEAEYTSAVERLRAAIDTYRGRVFENSQYVLTLQKQERGRKLSRKLQENPEVITNKLWQTLLFGGRWADRFTLRGNYIEILSLLPGARNRYRINWKDLTNQSTFIITEDPPHWADILTKVFNRVTGRDLNPNFGTLEIHPTQDVKTTVAKITTGNIRETRKRIEEYAELLGLKDKEVAEPKPVIQVGDLLDIKKICK